MYYINICSSASLAHTEPTDHLGFFGDGSVDDAFRTLSARFRLWARVNRHGHLAEIEAKVSCFWCSPKMSLIGSKPVFVTFFSRKKRVTKKGLETPFNLKPPVMGKIDISCQSLGIAYP